MVAEDLVEYRYVKIALMGDTSCGKTTLCSAIVTGDVGPQLSTFGRKIWTWNADSGEGRHRLIMSDNGGQEQVLETLLPLTIDSDIILYLFKKTDIRSFKNAIKFHERVKSQAFFGAKSFLVETHTDEDLTAVTDEYISKLNDSSDFEGLFKLNTRDIKQVNDLKDQLLKKINWSYARTVYQSGTAAKLFSTIDTLKSRKTGVTSFDKIKEEFEQQSGSTISKSALKFLLRNLSDAGILEYYPDIGDDVILNDPEFNKLRTDVPVYAGEHDGIVEINTVYDKFPSNTTQVDMLDRFYGNNGISIKFGEKRIFPALLAERPLRVPDEVSKYIDSGKIDKFEFKSGDINLYPLLSAMSDLNLDCLDITKNEGLFSWGSRSYLYYSINYSHTRRSGDTVELGYKVDGPDEKSALGLKNQLINLVNKLYSEESTVRGKA